MTDMTSVKITVFVDGSAMLQDADGKLLNIKQAEIAKEAQ